MLAAHKDHNLQSQSRQVCIYLYAAAMTFSDNLGHSITRLTKFCLDSAEPSKAGFCLYL